MKPGVYGVYVNMPYCYPIPKIDESCQDKAVFIFESVYRDKIWYDYDNNKAWNICHSIKAKKKLQYFRTMCKAHIDTIASNEDE